MLMALQAASTEGTVVAVFFRQPIIVICVLLIVTLSFCMYTLAKHSLPRLPKQSLLGQIRSHIKLQKQAAVKIPRTLSIQHICEWH